MFRKKRFAVFTLLTIFLLALPASYWVTAQQIQKYPKLHIALYELQAAHKELKDSRDSFGGHRFRAIMATNHAITTLKLMLLVKGDFHIADRNADFYQRHKDNPRLRQTLEDLREAAEELRESNDFGVLKARGLRDIGNAIAQIELVLQHVS